MLKSINNNEASSLDEASISVRTQSIPGSLNSLSHYACFEPLELGDQLAERNRKSLSDIGILYCLGYLRGKSSREKVRPSSAVIRNRN
jgi:hypothetical protein